MPLAANSTRSNSSNSSSRSSSNSNSSSGSSSRRSSFVKRSQAVPEQKKKMQQQQQQQQQQKRRLSLPNTIESVTVANEAKAHRRLSGRLSAARSRRYSFGSGSTGSAVATSAAATENNNENDDASSSSSPPKIQRPTPYAQVVLERGGTMSPPLTRSATKKKKQRLLPPRHDYENEETTNEQQQQQHTNNNSGNNHNSGLLIFSPPNQIENKRRERELLALQEAERSRRIQNARDDGQLLVFSPNGNNVVFPSTRHFLDENNNNNPTKQSSTRGSCGGGASTSSNNSGSSNCQKAATTPERSSSRRKSTSKDNTPSSFSATKMQLEARSQQLLEEYHALQQTKVKVEEQNKKLQMDLDHANEELLTQTANHQQDTSKLKSQLDSMHQEVEIRVNGLELVRSKLEHQVAQLHSEKADLTNQTIALQQRIAQLQQELQQNQNLIESMNRDNESEKEELAVNLERLDQENATLRQEIHVIETTKTAMQTKIIEYEHLIEKMQHHLLPEKESQLEKAIVQLRSKEQVVVELETKINNYSQLVQELRDEIQRITNNINNENRNLSTTLDKANQENNRMKMIVSEKEVKIQELVQQLDEVTRDLDEAQSSVTAARDECNRRCAAMASQINELNQALECTMQDLDTSKRSAYEIQQQLDQAHGQLKQALAEKDGAHSEKSQTSAAMSDLQVQLEHARHRIQSLERDCDSAKKSRQAMEQNLAYATNECQRLETERDNVRTHVAGFDAREAELTRRLEKSDQVRRELHASVMQLMGNIRVFVRVRPIIDGEVQDVLKQQQVTAAATANTLFKNASPAMIKKRKRELEHAANGDSLFRFPGLYDREEKQTSSTSTTSVTRSNGSEDILKNIIEVTEPWKDRGGLSERRIKHRFGFDQVFSPNHGQDDVWEATEPLVQSAIDGFNVCIFAYGQTGSGKTYTMLGTGGGGGTDSSGSSSSEQQQEGVIIRSIRKLFQAKQGMEELSKGETKVSVSVELIEIYNEQVRDLLSSDKGHVALKVNSQQGIVGNKIVSTSTEHAVMRVLTFAQKRRCVKATASNAESSRSHMLFTIHYEVMTKDGMKRAGKLHVCDLAGSERLNKSSAHVVGGSLLEETKHINQSLSVLSNVIEKLQAGIDKPPFRESQLTYILQNSLGGNSKTLAIVCCSPLQSNYHETLCSLRFAEKVNKVSLKKACANLSSSTN